MGGDNYVMRVKAALHLKLWPANHDIGKTAMQCRVAMHRTCSPKPHDYCHMHSSWYKYTTVVSVICLGLASFITLHALRA